MQTPQNMALSGYNILCAIFISLYLLISACAVIGARESGSSRLYVFFRDNTLWKFAFNTEDILTASYYSEKDIFTYYPDLNGRYPDAGCMFDGYVQFFFFGKYSSIM